MGEDQDEDQPGTKIGRPEWYKPEFAEQAYKLGLLGQTEAEMAEAFDVNVSTIQRWKRTKPAFRRAVTRAGATADADVAVSLRQRALGYSHKAVKIFMPPGAKEPVYAEYTEHYPPDTAAASLWLRNRQGGKWREKTDVVHSGTISLEAWVLESLPAPEPQQARVIEGEAKRVEGTTSEEKGDD